MAVCMYNTFPLSSGRDDLSVAIQDSAACLVNHQQLPRRCEISLGLCVLGKPAKPHWR